MSDVDANLERIFCRDAAGLNFLTFADAQTLICQQTKRAITDPKQPFESSRQGVSIRVMYSFISSFLKNEFKKVKKPNNIIHSINSCASSKALVQRSRILCRYLGFLKNQVLPEAQLVRSCTKIVSIKRSCDK